MPPRSAAGRLATRTRREAISGFRRRPAIRGRVTHQAVARQDVSVIPQRLSFVTLGALDLPRLRAFYEGMGWVPREGSNDEFAAFLLGGVILALYPRHLLHAEAAADLALPAPGTWSGLTLALNVEDRSEVDAVFDRAVRAGARPIAPPGDRDWGGRSGYVADPEDNRWEIAWAPGIAFTESGAVGEP